MSWWNPLTWFGSAEAPVKDEIPAVVVLGEDRLAGGDVDLRTGMVKLQAYTSGVIAALDALNEQPPENASAEDEGAWRKSVRNRIIAGGGEKARFFGTISTEPVVMAPDLEQLGFTRETAEALVAERDKLRAMALDMAPLGTYPEEKLEK